MIDGRINRFVRAHLKNRHLVLLAEIGLHGSIMRAAEAANLTQSAASKLIADLEHALGVPLFKRLPRGVEPTCYGAVMIRRAGVALAELNAAYQEVLELQSGLRGRISIGAVMTPSVELLPKAITAIRAAHPGIDISVSVDTSKQLVERLRAGELDMAVARILEEEAARELNFEPLVDESHSLIVRADHPLLAFGDLKIRDLAAAHWIVPPRGSILRDRLTAMFLSKGVSPPTGTIEVSALPVIVALLLESDLIVALPVDLVSFQLSSGQLAELPFQPELRLDPYGIVTRKTHELPACATVMLNELRDVSARRRRDRVGRAQELSGTLKLVTPALSCSEPRPQFANARPADPRSKS
jgi:DNA-binding transcriptional LysR family regulator